MNTRILVVAVFASGWISISPVHAIEPNEVFPVWPGKPPGQVRERGPEKLVEGRPRPFYQITDVSQPTVSVYLPPKARRTGAAVLVCPGGGLQRLAIEHEGFEVADWLTSQNVTVFVLKYRVPERAQVALQDAQRALSLIRARSGEWGVDPDDVGVIGFSAGAELAAWLATHHQDRQYEPIDASDKFSTRPAYAALIYPGGLLQGGALQLKAPLATNLNAQTPPMFVAQAFDDGSENSLAVVAALKRARVPAELHIYQDGGHGFGVRDASIPAGTWKTSWMDWLRSQGFLDNAMVRSFAQDLTAARQTHASLPSFSSRFPKATEADAYGVQRRLVRAAMKEDRVAGFNAIALTAPAQKRLKADHPLNSVVFRSQLVKAGASTAIDLAITGESEMALAVGYTISVDISFKILNDTQAQGSVSAVAPMVELSGDDAGRLEKSARDIAAANGGSSRYIVGASKPLPGADVSAVRSSLKINGQEMPGAIGGGVGGSPWADLRRLLNQITAQGYTLHAGDLIVCGLSSPGRKAGPGKYQADFGALGSVDFNLR